jgi:uncharacterized membrane protein
LEHTFGAQAGEEVKVDSINMIVELIVIVGFIEDLEMTQPPLKAFWQPG